MTEIQPPSVRAETLNVLKAAAAVILIAAAYVLRPSFAGGGAPAAERGGGLLPYQRLVSDAPSPEQRVFRELREGLLEAERLRSISGQWPDVATLSVEGIPPFAQDPTRKSTYSWSSVRQDWVVNYLGIPSDPAEPAWVLVILEPEPGVPPDPAPNDETHHRLPDGTTLHVSIWNTPEQKRRTGFAALRLPQNEGWTQLLVGEVSGVQLPVAASASQPFKVGVTLHPYYSWATNVVGNLPGYEVRALLPGDIDAGDYQPRPEDIKKLADLDAIVVNGIGHDDFIFPMLKAAGNTHATIIRVNAETPMIRARGGTGPNAHTFMSFSNAIQQAYAIQKALAAMRPQDATRLQQNAAEYARRLRAIKSKASAQLAGATITRVVTVHDGYGYLLQEFGLEIAGVVQPAHGLIPSAAELRDMVALLKRERIGVVFSEASFPAPLLNVLRDEAGVDVHLISHVASGPFTADKFEREMQQNVETMIRALVRAR